MDTKADSLRVQAQPWSIDGLNKAPKSSLLVKYQGSRDPPGPILTPYGPDMDPVREFKKEN